MRRVLQDHRGGGGMIHRQLREQSGENKNCYDDLVARLRAAARAEPKLPRVSAQMQFRSCAMGQPTANLPVNADLAHRDW